MKPIFISVGVLSLLLCLPHLASIGQNQNSNWHFGDGLSLNFQGNNVTAGSSALNASGINQPSIISDPFGNVICYTDGNKLFNGEDAEIHDFASTTSENLILPHPMGNDRYYLFRSGSNGLKYAIIDMTLNGGAGGINAGEDDMELSDYNCQLVCARNTNGTDYWLVAADNNNGNTDDVTIRVYNVSGDTITAGDSEGQYYLFGGWYATLDEMRIAPDCSKIVIAYKGHYLVLVKFDNATGMLSDLLTTSLDAGNSFGTADLDQWEFSSDGNYLFDLEDHAGITRYYLVDWSINAINATAEVVVPFDWNNADIWTDMKLAIDGNIYLCNTNDDQIDVIENTSEPLEDLEIVEGILTFESGLTNFFPNTPNVSCVSLDASVFHQYECLGDSTELWYSTNLMADSVLWDFGDPNTGDYNASTEDAPIHVFSETGSFAVTLHVFFEGVETLYDHEVNIYTVPDLELGPDQEFCAGGNTTIGPDAVKGMSYSWNTGQSTSTIDIIETGEYELTITNVGCQVSDLVEITVFDPVGTGLQDQVILCDESSYVIQANAANAETYQWSTGATTSSITVNSSGTYWVNASNECFSESDTTEVIFIQIPDLITEPSIQGCYGDTITLTSNYQLGSIDWSTGEEGQQIEVTEAGTYTVMVDYLGCEAEDQIEVVLEEFIPLSWIEIPNIFTPDGNEDNPVFRPFVTHDPGYKVCQSPALDISMNVYNRWGNLLAEGVCSWDGHAPDAGISHEGVYYYIIEINSACYKVSQHEKRDGYVHLIKN